ncbi:MAG: Rrf2 family transcriptional regulator [Pseudomonadota bacterium]
MRLTTRGRYAVAAMFDLALQPASQPVALADIAGRQDISLSYLEQLFGRLRRAGLVESVRGPGGGYRLARETDAISVAEILSAVDELLDATHRGSHKTCQREQRCPTHNLWQALTVQIEHFLSRVTLADLLVEPGNAEQPLRHMKLPSATGSTPAP